MKVEFKPKAIEYLANLDKSVAQRIISKIKWLADNFDFVKKEKLKSKRWSEKFKLRVGDYRVIYNFIKEKELISVHLIGQRKEIYKVID